jgi:hypothetical protein
MIDWKSSTLWAICDRISISFLIGIGEAWHSANPASAGWTCHTDQADAIA